MRQSRRIPGKAAREVTAELLLASCLMSMLVIGLTAAEVRLGTWKLNIAKSKLGKVALISQTDICHALRDGRVQISRTREFTVGKTEKYTLSY